MVRERAAVVVRESRRRSSTIVPVTTMTSRRTTLPGRGIDVLLARRPRARRASRSGTRRPARARARRFSSAALRGRGRRRLGLLGDRLGRSRSRASASPFTTPRSVWNGALVDGFAVILAALNGARVVTSNCCCSTSSRRRLARSTGRLGPAASRTFCADRRPRRGAASSARAVRSSSPKSRRTPAEGATPGTSWRAHSRAVRATPLQAARAARRCDRAEADGAVRSGRRADAACTRSATSRAYAGSA